MSYLDEIINEEKERHESKETVLSDKKAWGEARKAERNAIYELIDDMVNGLQESEKNLKMYLNVQAKFPHYSVGNALLITAQRPDATEVGSADYWKETKGAYIRRNEKGISILEPGATYAKEDGSTGISYNVKKVFDVSQLNLRNRVDKSKGSHDEKLLIKALINKSKFGIKSVERADGIDGALYDYNTNSISVIKDVGFDKLFQSLARELFHAEFAQNISDGEYARKEKNGYANMGAYMICARNGVDIKSFDFSEVRAHFDNQELGKIRANLADVRDVMQSMSEKMSKVLEPESRSERQQSMER